MMLVSAEDELEEQAYTVKPFYIVRPEVEDVIRDLEFRDLDDFDEFLDIRPSLNKEISQPSAIVHQASRAMLGQVHLPRMALAGLTRFDIGEQAEDPVAMHLAVMDSEIQDQNLDGKQVPNTGRDGVVRITRQLLSVDSATGAPTGWSAETSVTETEMIPYSVYLYVAPTPTPSPTPPPATPTPSPTPPPPEEPTPPPAEEPTPPDPNPTDPGTSPDPGDEEPPDEGP